MIDDRTKNHLSLALSHEADLSRRAFDRALQQMYAEFSIAGRFHSGARIMTAVSLMAETALGFLRTAVSRAREISDDHVSFLIAATRTQTLVGELEALLPSVVWFPGGRGGSNDQAAFDAATKSFAVIRRDVGVELHLAEFKFEPKLGPLPRAEPRPAKSVGGRPRVKSHDAVAKSVMTELLELSNRDFSRVVGVSVQAMMSKAHVKLGETPFVDMKNARFLLREARAKRAG